MNIMTFINSDYSSWGLAVQFGIVSLMLLFANVIRKRVKIFKSLLMPTAIIAGFLGLALKYIFLSLDFTIEGNPVIDNRFLEGITYHAIALGFIAMGLKTAKKLETNEIKGKPFKTGLIIVSTYLIQGLVGVLVTVVIANIFTDILPHVGLLLPMGFGQGPGQAANIGGVFDDNNPLAINGIYKTLGLAIATFGTLWSCIAGVFYINRKVKDGSVVRASAEEAVDVTSDLIESKEEIPVSEAIDKMSIQLIFVSIVYLVTYLFIKGITTIIPAGFQGLIWGFNFIFGMLFAMLFKLILNYFTKKGIIKQKYTNEYMLNRITGVVFDFMIVASIMAIDMKMLSRVDLWITLLIITTIGGIVTWFYLKFVIKKTYPDYEAEAFSVLFGNLTGTASNGIALLREIDPEFKTPAADDLVTGSSTAVLFGAPILIITGLIHINNYYLWGSIIVMALLFGLFLTILLKAKKLR